MRKRAASAGRLGAMVLAWLAVSPGAPAQAADVFFRRTISIASRDGWKRLADANLGEDGRAVFVASVDSSGTTRVFSGSGAAAPTAQPTPGIAPASAVWTPEGMVVAGRVSRGGARFVGAYNMTSGASAATTLFEEAEGSYSLFARLARSESGDLAFSSVRDGRGRVVRKLVGQSPEVLAAPGMAPFNVVSFDLNDTGRLALSAEVAQDYLKRAIIVLDAPAAWPDYQSALDGQENSAQTVPAVTYDGEVLFSLKSVPLSPTVNSNDALFRTVPSPYHAEPRAYPSTPMKEGAVIVADAGFRFRAGQAVEVSEAGDLAFEAELETGVLGIFVGPDPVKNAVQLVGSSFDGATVRSVALLDMNGDGDLLALLGVTTPSGVGDSYLVRYIRRTIQLPTPCRTFPCNFSLDPQRRSFPP